MTSFDISYQLLLPCLAVLDVFKKKKFELASQLILLIDHIKRYKPSAKFGDRRDGNVASARTYFYTNEAACEKNMETFLRCIEAVAGKK